MGMRGIELGLKFRLSHLFFIFFIKKIVNYNFKRTFNIFHINSVKISRITKFFFFLQKTRSLIVKTNGSFIPPYHCINMRYIYPLYNICIYLIKFCTKYRKRSRNLFICSLLVKQ